MRHFKSILLAVVLAPAAWVLVAVGLSHDSLLGLLLLLLGGVAYGILAVAPISPLGPVVAGLACLAAGGWAAEAPSGYASMWPDGQSELSRPGHGLAVVLAVPLLMTVLRRRRAIERPPVGLPAPRTTLSGLFEGAEERTTLLKRPSSDGELTTVVRKPGAGEATTVLRGPEDEEPPTMSLVGERATEDLLVREAPSEDGASEDSGAATPNDDGTTAELGAEAPGKDPVPESAAADGIAVADGEAEKEAAGTEPAAPEAGVAELGSPGEETRVIRRRNGDQTQVIRLPDDGERTQLLGARRTGPDRGGSIAGAESPNFADDPTGRLQRPAPADEAARSMTVMNLERPPEIPAPRKSPESEG